MDGRLGIDLACGGLVWKHTSGGYKDGPQMKAHLTIERKDRGWAQERAACTGTDALLPMGHDLVSTLLLFLIMIVFVIDYYRHYSLTLAQFLRLVPTQAGQDPGGSHTAKEQN